MGGKEPELRILFSVVGINISTYKLGEAIAPSTFLNSFARRTEVDKDMKDLINFGVNVFNDSVMHERLPKEVFRALKKAIAEGGSPSPEVAQVVSNAMKDWAIEKGATHYCHWFMPMTGQTSEKHDAFLTPTDDGKAIMELSGKNLIQGEPDASSFPSGGLRATFEARGYTAWDMTSPAFVKDNSLYIPTAFCSYNNEALDKKTPLLRSIDRINTAAVKFLSALGVQARKVVPSVGAEQEYFLIDREYYAQRHDLMLTGRTLFGALPPKGQELSDHYFGALKTRVSDYMKELDHELWSYGVTSKTKHNEAAPAQHEIAPVYSVANLATDHNYLTMELMKKVAERHGLVCLLHEKPFEGVNGSGKHNNWSLITDSGCNLLEYNRDGGIEDNKIFLMTITAVIRAVDKYADLLRMSVANAGQDHRLGAHEAPPSIMSIYLGENISAILENAANGISAGRKSKDIELNVSTLPKFAADDADRNRTSPFALTGNKFEFRMVGSSASIAGPNTIINAIVADSLEYIADKLNAGESLTQIIKEIYSEHGRVVFNGDNYSHEWVKEAERRGLNNFAGTVDSYAVIKNPKNIELLSRLNIYSEKELNSRYEILFDNYNKTVNIEGLATVDIAKTEILPASEAFLAALVKTVKGLDAIGQKGSYLTKRVEKVLGLNSELYEAIEQLEESLAYAAKQEGVYGAAVAYRDRVLSGMVRVRKVADTLEKIVDKAYWPMPTYFDLLFRI